MKLQQMLLIKRMDYKIVTTYIEEIYTEVIYTTKYQIEVDKKSNNGYEIIHNQKFDHAINENLIKARNEIKVIDGALTTRSYKIFVEKVGNGMHFDNELVELKVSVLRELQVQSKIAVTCGVVNKIEVLVHYVHTLISFVNIKINIIIERSSQKKTLKIIRTKIVNYFLCFFL